MFKEDICVAQDGQRVARSLSARAGTVALLLRKGPRELPREDEKSLAGKSANGR